MSMKPRTTAATLAVLAALALTVTAPATADARVHGGPVQIATIPGIDEQPRALVAPGQPPTPCTPGRWKCPLGKRIL
ncbi:hypothetical protein ACRAWB_15060 [Leifsonia poae]|uniref:hypothetical protein n=1 Tax=Leifsonia poae TaxID=110933 RepID=UPI003D69F30A